MITPPSCGGRVGREERGGERETRKVGKEMVINTQGIKTT